jgi:hypothetical protein
LLQTHSPEATIVNVGCPTEVSILDLAHRVLARVGRSPAIQFVDYTDLYRTGSTNCLVEFPISPGCVSSPGGSRIAPWMTRSTMSSQIRLGWRDAGPPRSASASQS